MRAFLAFVCVLATASFVPPLAIAAKKEKLIDKIWVHPDLSSFRIDRIAMLPVATYDNNLAAEKLVESHVGQAFQGSGHRWISATSVRDLLRSQTGSDSLSKTVKQGILKEPRVDSLLAPGVCGRLRCQALLSVRVDLWEQVQLEWDQAGKPSTSIQLKAALVDSAGRLLWTASGSQVAEGQFNDPNAGNAAGRDAAINRSNAARPAAPTYHEVLGTLLARWATQFPPRMNPAPAPAATPPDKTGS